MNKGLKGKAKLSFSTIWMNLVNTVQTEISQAWKDTSWSHLYVECERTEFVEVQPGIEWCFPVARRNKEYEASVRINKEMKKKVLAF